MNAGNFFRRVFHTAPSVGLRRTALTVADSAAFAMFPQSTATPFGYPMASNVPAVSLHPHNPHPAIANVSTTILPAVPGETSLKNEKRDYVLISRQYDGIRMSR
jgi:hypothetical protein